LLNRLFLYTIISIVYGSEIHDKQINKSFIMFAGAKFNLVQNGDSPNRYIWLHGDEQTARMALEYHIGLYNGLAFFIESETREIPFKSTIVDPNRIFSRDGAYYALRKFKPGWQPGTLKMALDEIDRERESFLDILMPNKNGLLISLHNNFRGYNVHKEKGNSQRISIKKNENPRDFIICTNSSDFEILVSSPYNVVLQNELPERDDGSLSWEALRRNVRYLNIETRLGYLSKQKAMLKYIEDNLN
tara:strand:+ start:226 stop:963 length:738 start_codon:yes stop_codon:yes gene_type:complete